MFIGVIGANVYGDDNVSPIVEKPDFTAGNHICKDSFIVSRFGEYSSVDWNSNYDLFYDKHSIVKNKNSVSVWGVFIGRIENTDLINDGSGYMMMRFTFNRHNDTYVTTDTIFYDCSGNPTYISKGTKIENIVPGTLVESLRGMVIK